MDNDTFDTEDDAGAEDVLGEVGYDDEENASDEYDDYGEEDAESQPALSGKHLSHALSDEAGTRLSLTDIHGGTLKPIDMGQEMKTSLDRKSVV